MFHATGSQDKKITASLQLQLFTSKLVFWDRVGFDNGPEWMNNSSPIPREGSACYTIFMVGGRVFLKTFAYALGFRVESLFYLMFIIFAFFTFYILDIYERCGTP